MKKVNEMRNINAKDPRSGICTLTDCVNINAEPVVITSVNGRRAVLISEEQYNKLISQH